MRHRLRSYCLIFTALMMMICCIVWIYHAFLRNTNNYQGQVKELRSMHKDTIQITSELRASCEHMLDILVHQIGYRGTLFQDSMDIIHQQINLDVISSSQIDPVFQALIWLTQDQSPPYQLFNTTLNVLQRFSLAVFYFSTQGDVSWTHCARQQIEQSLQEPKLPNDPCPEKSRGKTYFLSHHHHECHWHGITCNPDRKSYIQMMDFSNNAQNLSGTIPVETVLLSSSLQLLWLSQNPNLSGSIPEWINYMQGLTSLSLHDTHMSGTIPPSVYKLKNLESLRLHDSRFSGTISSEISQLHRLKWIWIHNNELVGSFPINEICNLHTLEGLSLYGNSFDNHETIETDELCHLRDLNLKHLWVDCHNGGDGTECKCCSMCLPKKLALDPPIK